MNKSEVLQAWASILAGRAPSLSIEITKECPLRCPGCYAFDAAHLGGSTQLRELSDFKGDDLVARVLAVIDENKPLHVSLVGGDPLVRYRELDALIPQIQSRGVHVQIVTSAFREIPAAWMKFKKLNIVVSVDGLQPEHDMRRKPATYERIQQNIRGQRVTVHFTVTGQIARQQNYFERFLDFWSQKPEIKRIWISLFTPQIGATGPEILSPAERTHVVDELERLLPRYPVLDISERVLREFRRPPQSPGECIFAQTTQVISADLKTRVTPCQFGGNPDCSQCGCMASMGLAAVGHLNLGAGLTLGRIYNKSVRIGHAIGRLRNIDQDIDQDIDRNIRKEVA